MAPDDDGETAAQSEAFELLDVRIQQFLWQEGWSELRRVQERAIAHVLGNDADLIVAAATASGKTEAVFLPALTQLVRSPAPQLIVYVSPLKALINDQFDRLSRLCGAIDVPVWPWHGDIGASVKQRFWRDPAGVLLITPESLEAMLCNKPAAIARALARTTLTVVDELHAFIGTERGKQLQSLLHRAEHVAERRIRRIGLSATIGDLGLAAAYLRPGRAGQVELVDERGANSELRVLLKGYREPAADTAPAGSDEAPEPITPRQIAGHLFSVLRGSNNLVFPNSRREVERYTHYLRALCEEAGTPNEFWPHHGSLAPDVRADTERALKGEGTAAVPATAVCTNTLELGIDVGAVKCVAQIGPAPSVASLRQRLGRSGRRRGEPAILRAYSIEDAVERHSSLGARLRLRTVRLIAQIELLIEGWCEPPARDGLFLSTLIQQIIATLGASGGKTASELFRLLCAGEDSPFGQAPFAAVRADTFARLLRCLGASNIVMQDSSGLLLLGPRGERLREHYSFYAAFAEQEEYRVEADGRLLGGLPTSTLFQLGQRIVFAGRTWQIVAIEEERHAISVEPTRGGAPPAFEGTVAGSHERVQARMRSLLEGDTLPPYLDDNARGLLAEGRQGYRTLGLDQRVWIREGGDLVVFTWLGDAANQALALLARAAGLQAEAVGVGFVLTGGAADPSSLGESLRAMAATGGQALRQATMLASNLAREKWDHLLDRTLLAENFESRFVDISRARAWLCEAEALLPQTQRS